MLSSLSSKEGLAPIKRSFRGESAEGGEGFVLGAVFSEINLTPLTDIFLVLLVIFMVTSSAMHASGVAVNLPAASSELQETPSEGVVVTLLPSGVWLLNGKALSKASPEVLEQQLKELWARPEKRSSVVILEGDKEVSLEKVVAVMDAAKRAGASQIAISTASEKATSLGGGSAR